MALFERATETGVVSLHYEVRGNPKGHPVLAIAPGGMKSSIAVWDRIDWNPLTELEDFRLVLMDQRNAGESTAPVAAGDGWPEYTSDQLALMDHLGIDRFSVVGVCIGGSYIIGLLRAAPDRIDAAAMLQPIGLDANRDAFFAMFDAWADEIRDAHPEATAEDWRAFRDNMYGSDDFVFNATEADFSSCDTPLLLFYGDDLYHPASTSRRIAEAAPNVASVEHWKEPDLMQENSKKLVSFLRQHRGDHE